MEDRRFVVRVAAEVSLGAALVHVWAMPEHLAEWWGYGVFFLLVTLAQGLYGVALVTRPGRALFLLGVGGNLAVVSLYVVTRTVGILFFGPHAGEVEAVGLTDSVATVLEVALVVALGALSRATRLPEVASPVGPVWGSGAARVGAMGSGVSRRDFLRAAGAVGAVGASAGVLGAHASRSLAQGGTTAGTPVTRPRPTPPTAGTGRWGTWTRRGSTRRSS